jgi:hypothetical protein
MSLDAYEVSDGMSSYGGHKVLISLNLGGRFGTVLPAGKVGAGGPNA